MAEGPSTTDKRGQSRMNGIMERETYQDLPQKCKLDILYDMQVKTLERIEKLETKKIFNTVTSAISGVIGGFMAYFSSKFMRNI